MLTIPDADRPITAINRATIHHELEVLSTLVESYEEKHCPIPPPDPVEAIKFRMEQLGLKQSDMIKY